MSGLVRRCGRGSHVVVVVIVEVVIVTVAVVAAWCRLLVPLFLVVEVLRSCGLSTVCRVWCALENK